jgi:Ser-tRNA(Ala) deacylase AlaX
LYLLDTYQAEITTAVIHAQPGWVAVADNIFHPQGGGQPSDRGTVDGVAASPRWDDAGEAILLQLDGDHAFRPEQNVTVRIDPELRKLHAALHTAGHLIDAIVRRMGYTHAANNHFPGQSRVEFRVDGDVDKTALTERLEAEIAAAVDKCLPVTAETTDGVRRITIDSLGTDPCGGTHVPHLGALRDVRVRSVKTKGGRLKVGYHAEHAH